MMNLCIEDIGLSCDAYILLKKYGVSNIKEMALFDLNNISNCSFSTIKEIKDKINYLVSEGFYDPEFVNQYIDSSNNKCFVDYLKLSNRSKNILKTLEIDNINKLLDLDENILSNTKNAGINTVKEIVLYINEKRYLEDLNGYINVKSVYFPINKIDNFCGETKITELSLSEDLVTLLEKYNIYSIYDLIINKINFINNKEIEKEYKMLYDCFYELACGRLEINLSDEFKKCYTDIPFVINDYFQLYDRVRIDKLITFSIEMFDILSIKDKINVKLFLAWLCTFNIDKPIEYYIDNFKFKRNEKYIISQRVYRTLEDIGNELSVSRERVRQIEKRAYNKIKNKYKKIKSPFSRLLDKDKYCARECSIDELVFLYIDKKYNDEFFLVIKENESCFYHNELTKKISNLINDQLNNLEKYGYIDFDNSIYDNDLFYESIKYLKLNFYNGHIFKNMNKRTKVKYAMRYINRPINIYNKNDIRELIDVTKKIFGLELYPGRAIEGLIIGAGVRVGSATYAADDIVIPLSKDILNGITEYVTEKKIINARDLFVPYGNVFKKHNIYNETILYRYLKQELSSRLYFCGVSGVISSDQRISSWGEVVIDYIKNKGEPVHKLEVMNKIGFTEGVFNNLAINFDDIIQWSSKELYLKSLIKYSEETKKIIIDKINEYKIVSFNYIKALLERLEPGIIKNNFIINENNFIQFLNVMLGNIFVIDKSILSVRVKNDKNRIIKKEYSVIEELTL